MLASTQRAVIDVDHHRMSARIDLREEAVETDEMQITGIVDRIGTGDAFAAGVLHALRRGEDARQAADTGLALGALKHSLPGDASLFTQSDLDAFHRGGLDVRR